MSAVADIVKRLRRRDGPGCFYCGTKMVFEPALGFRGRFGATVEHLIDRKYGGTRSGKNAVLAHYKCNNGRSGMSFWTKIESRLVTAGPIPAAVATTVASPEMVLAEMIKQRKRAAVVPRGGFTPFPPRPSVPLRRSGAW